MIIKNENEVNDDTSNFTLSNHIQHNKAFPFHCCHELFELILKFLIFSFLQSEKFLQNYVEYCIFGPYCDSAVSIILQPTQGNFTFALVQQVT